MRLIDADALIKKCGGWYTEEGPAEGFIGTIEMLVNEQPTIEPKQEWIPCSERLPNEDGTYLVTDEWVGKTGTKYIEIEGIDFENGRWDCHDYEKVIAWMSLPAPYRTTEESSTDERCKEIHDDGVTCERYPACGDCEENPSNKKQTDCPWG